MIMKVQNFPKINRDSKGICILNSREYLCWKNVFSSYLASCVFLLRQIKVCLFLHQKKCLNWRETGNQGDSGWSESGLRNLETLLCYLISLFCSEQLKSKELWNQKQWCIIFLRPSVPVTRIYVTKSMEWKKPGKEHCLLLHWHLDNEINET